MKGADQIVTALNDVLTAELTAVNQYFIHARMCENWGYQRLWKKVRAESIEEMKHADALIERGAWTADAVTAACGAGGDCGACTLTLADLVAESETAAVGAGARP